MMKKTLLSHAILWSVALVGLSGCVNVQPEDRAYLAKDDMQLDPDPLDAKFRQHMYFAREATPGGNGPSGSNCGCN